MKLKNVKDLFKKHNVLFLFDKNSDTSQKNQHGIERDSTLNLIVKSAERITSSDFLNSVVIVAVDNSEQTV